ncbi:hypothetical protein [Wenzhouxiangella sediminis]|uniref:Peptidase MA-like domain-containing protein n=1 Tax=Wenzhouxiangella sediminis TaxID=1792836 RepID=A0A3E1K7E4_9GAMM|nr:hypothetical protein [Wenzhouxiangella sediminis]RFF29956.1 hypothetical protein DZC52_11030 [Wenzhouxiangella sediminis]
MSRNLGFCGLAVIVFLVTVVRPVASGGCADPDLFRGWGETAPPVAVLGAGSWYRASLGWILAPGDCAARQVAEEMDAASAAFEHHFGLLAPRGAVIDVAHARHAPALKEAGAAWVLPWRFDQADEAADARAEAIRTQVRAQLASGGREPDAGQVEALVERALDELGEDGAAETSSLEPKAIRHEIAHLLFMHAVWPSSAGRGEQYGGDAPDWLDEAAAVVAESADMTEARRQAFRELARSGRTIPLEEYLSMEHPVFAAREFQALVDQARAQAEAGGAAVVSASLPAEHLERARAFYAQTRGFTDYLVHRSGDDRVLAEIATTMRGGAAFEAWLAASGVESGLPGDLQDLEREFDSWARETGGALPDL